MQEKLLEAIEKAGPSGVVVGDLFGNTRTGAAAVGVTNALANLRAQGVVTTRREERDGVHVQVYYSAAAAPAGTPRGEGS